MKRFSFAVVFVLLVMLSGLHEVRASGDGSCPWWRPCGPGNSWGGNRLIGQGFGQVDFRPACASHDACLAAGVPRRQCDRQFYAHMSCACEQSPHPVLCRMKALKFYAAVRIFGGLYH
ncbi:MAG: hypothetical protein R3C49_20500 [Planctomycetaceae bacterium]